MAYLTALMFNTSRNIAIDAKGLAGYKSRYCFMESPIKWVVEYVGSAAGLACMMNFGRTFYVTEWGVGHFIDLKRNIILTRK